MICTAPAPQSINELYMKIRSTRPQWFKAATGLEEDNYVGFENWIMKNINFWYSFKDNVVLVERQNFVVVCHPLFLGPIQMDFLQEVLDELHNIAVHRIEVPLLSSSGLVIKKVLRSLGFQQEGTLRQKERIRSPKQGQYIYLDVQLWAKLLEGDIHG